MAGGGGVPAPRGKPLHLLVRKPFPSLRLWPLPASIGEERRRRGPAPSWGNPSPLTPRGLGKGSILRRGARSIRPRDANEGGRVPTARTLCGRAHLLLGERPLCPRQFTGNLACANGPAPLCGPRRHWPPSVGTAAAPGPQAQPATAPI